MTPRRGLMLVIALAGLAVARPVAAERVDVKVVAIAGGVVYVAPGENAGLRPGLVIRFGKRQLAIIEVTAGTAAATLDDASLDLGDRGVVDGVSAQIRTRRLPAPRPASTWNAQWPAAPLPAAAQRPSAVRLGAATASGQLHAALSGSVIAVPGESLEGRARLVASYDLWQASPLAADLDASARLFASGYQRGGQVPLWIRAAQLRYGAAADPRLALGRLPWAATGVGLLDGARASLRLGGLELAAFGGVVPDELDGLPAGDAGRFGGEVLYAAPVGRWQPRLALTAVGSTWQGELDERRAAVHAGLGRGGFELEGWAEAQAFPAGNPWGARAVELIGAGASAEYRRRGSHLGVEATLLRPERSLRLAATLPRDWLCATAPGTGDPEACVGHDFWTWVTASAGLATPRLLLDAGGSVGTTHQSRRAVDASGFARLEVRGLPRRGRAFAQAGYGHASFVEWIGGELGVGAAPRSDLELGVAYRPEWIAYSARTAIWRSDSVVLDARWSLGTTLDVGGAAIATRGPDRNALLLLATAAWRPR